MKNKNPIISYGVKLKNSNEYIAITEDNLSTYIAANCEIVEVSEGISGERIDFLGVLSGNALLYLFTEISEYALINYSLEGPRSEEMNYYSYKAICMAKEFLKDPDLVSLDDIINTIQKENIFDSEKAEGCYTFFSAYYCLRVAFSLKQRLLGIKESESFDMVLFFESCPFQAAFAADKKLNPSGAIGAGAKILEFSRQGKFIIDFLKSGKHLFMV